MSKVCHLIMYDCIVFFYIFYTIFNFIWAILGKYILHLIIINIGLSWWNSENDSGSVCADEGLTGNLMPFWNAVNIILLCFILLGFIVFLITLCVYAMDEGE